ncbi:MAG: hypothetical protein QW735_00130 [archaeon]
MIFKNLLAFFLLISVVLAQCPKNTGYLECDSYISNAEKYLKEYPGSFQVALEYFKAAECFSNLNLSSYAKCYYSLSAEYFNLSASSLREEADLWQKGKCYEYAGLASLKIGDLQKAFFFFNLSKNFYRFSKDYSSAERIETYINSLYSNPIMQENTLIYNLVGLFLSLCICLSLVGIILVFLRPKEKSILIETQLKEVHSKSKEDEIKQKFRKKHGLI